MKDKSVYDSKPLPEKLRPERLTEFFGQEHLVGKNSIIKKLIQTGKKTGFFPSVILWGPPGSGKTTLARIISRDLKRNYFEFSAVNTSSKEIEKVIKSLPQKNTDLRTEKELFLFKEAKTVIFLDEIHRFNKAQQDKLLPYVERGDFTLIGATTENPSFEVIGPLLSRMRVLTLKQLEEKDLHKILKKALSFLNQSIHKNACDFLIESSNGDARVLLSTLEIAHNLNGKEKLKVKDIEEALQKRQLSFDKKGEEFYNVISSFIKSMRASNVNAALYYLARMTEAGQDPLYIARRMVVFASEDIGMAQPTALVVANDVFRACETIGYPECAINLAHGTVYLAKAKKDRSAYEAYFRAVDDVKRYGNLPVPLKIRNAPTKLMKDLQYGKGYEPYTNEDLLPEKLKGKKYFNPKK